jgi:hypothetical protein
MKDLPLRAFIPPRLCTKNKETPGRCQAVTKFIRRSGFPERSFGFVTACKRRVSRVFGPSCKSVLFKAASNQNLLFPHDMPSRTEAHTNSGQRPTNLACAGEGSAPLPRQGTAQPLPLGADERSEKCRTMLSPPVLPERHRAPQGVR